MPIEFVRSTASVAAGCVEEAAKATPSHIWEPVPAVPPHREGNDNVRAQGTHPAAIPQDVHVVTAMFLNMLTARVRDASPANKPAIHGEN
jgi:hypothetical protein